MKLILFTLLLLNFVNCGWNSPKKVLGLNEIIADQRHYLDSASKTIHFVYTHGNNRVLKTSYVGYFPNETTIKTDFLPNNIHFSAHITGANDGQNIFAVFCASRQAGSGPKEVFFTESEDGGISWKNPVPIPRDNMNDNIDRLEPKILYIKETRRLFIFFAQYGSGSYKGVYAATRAAGSKIFSKESEIDSKYQMQTDLSATYTWSNNIANIIVHWFTPRDSEKGIHIGAYSMDNGVKWTVIKSGHYEWTQRTAITASARFDPKKAIMVYNCIGDIFEVFFDTVKQTFTEIAADYKNPKSFITDITICRDRHNVELLYYFGTATEYDNATLMNWYRWTLSGKYDKLGVPFSASQIYSSSVTCDQENYQVLVSSILFEAGEYKLSINRWDI